ncbi:cell wall-binding repeat-containing protein [uncultured Finegoldia sp.]|uniref:cell wall-binding repeat-containing protein n=1 Tax=uncultured Finegoldia sp. TaxID=328009 RepID=UPI0026043F1B|nr:cell wall-binding repeat-containing protein [uncultured Finegoldia sp.]
MKKFLIFCLCFLFLSTKSKADGDLKLDKSIIEDYSDLSVQLNKEMFNKIPNLVIVNEKKESDVISALSFAYKNKSAIMLIKNDGDYVKEDSPILNETIRLKAKNVYIIGGEKSVCEKVSDNLKLKGLLVTRIDGKNRFEVAKNVIKENTNLNPTDTLVISDSSNFSYVSAKIGSYLKNGFAISFVNGKKFDDSIIKLAIDRGISKVIIDQPYSVVGKIYDDKLKENGFKVIRNDYKSVYEANFSQNSGINYSKIIFTDYKDTRATLLSSYVCISKNYVNVLVNEGNVDKTTNKLLSTSTKPAVYIGRSESNFTNLAKKLELFYKID